MAPPQRIDRNEALFLHLVVSLQSAAYQQMGKIASPITGKVEKDLDQAQNSIDMLGMIQEKTKGNLSESEAKIIENILFELRMNYLEELKEQKKRPEQKTPPAKDKTEEQRAKQTARETEEAPQQNKKGSRDSAS